MYIVVYAHHNYECAVAPGNCGALKGCQIMVATSFKSHEICRISISFVLLHIAFILLL